MSVPAVLRCVARVCQRLEARVPREAQTAMGCSATSEPIAPVG